MTKTSEQKRQELVEKIGEWLCSRYFASPYHNHYKMDKDYWRQEATDLIDNTSTEHASLEVVENDAELPVCPLHSADFISAYQTGQQDMVDQDWKRVIAKERE